MKQIVGIAFLVVGIVLLCLAYNSYHSAASGVSRVITGTSTDKTISLVIGGAVVSALGLGSLMTGSKKA
jgi:drug/metabolite transporter (DMT)-like permease